MKAQRILFPTDFSPNSEAALAYAAMLAHDLGAELLIAHVYENPAAYVVGDLGAFGSEGDVMSHVRQLLAGCVPTSATVNFRHLVRMGSPADEILRLAKDENVDLIVMATHGRTGLPRLLMGSVAETVIRHAPCPVIAYKPRLTAQVHAEATA